MKKSVKRHFRKVFNRVRRFGKSPSKLPLLNPRHKRFYR